jgi:signal transduction histidine kinase
VRSGEGEQIVLSVEDTGIGIASEHMERIFERFYRASSQDESIPAGSGLGLSLAKWIAERHGARLSVQSTVGKGSRFSFSLESAAVGHSAFDAVDPLNAKSKENTRNHSSLSV